MGSVLTVVGTIKGSELLSTSSHKDNQLYIIVSPSMGIWWCHFRGVKNSNRGACDQDPVLNEFEMQHDPHSKPAQEDNTSGLKPSARCVTQSHNSVQ